MTAPLLRQAETALRALLLADPGVIALVPSQRIAIDAVAPTLPKPYIVFARSAPAEFTNGISGAVMAVRVPIAIQVVDRSSEAAAAVADVVRQALVAQKLSIESSESGHDSALDVDVETLNIDWWLTP